VKNDNKLNKMKFNLNGNLSYVVCPCCHVASILTIISLDIGQPNIHFVC